MLVNSNGLLSKALKEGYAIPSYNINNLEWTKYILEACNSDRCPVILAVSLSAVNYFGGYKVVYNVVKSLIDELDIKIPVVLHLDHAKTFLECKSAIDAGFTSVMIDVSDKTKEEAINIVSEVTSYASLHNVSVESELGSFDNTLGAYSYTDVDDSKEFAVATGINSFAPAVGNMHGLYKDDVKIDFDLLGALCKSVKVPLVLHGASGLDDNKIKTAIFCGVAKININTDLQIAWSNAVRKYLEDNKEVYDPRKVIASGKSELKSVIHEKNTLFGCKNQI